MTVHNEYWKLLMITVYNRSTQTLSNILWFVNRYKYRWTRRWMIDPNLLTVGSRRKVSVILWIRHLGVRFVDRNSMTIALLNENRMKMKFRFGFLKVCAKNKHMQRYLWCSNILETRFEVYGSHISSFLLGLEKKEKI